MHHRHPGIVNHFGVWSGAGVLTGLFWWQRGQGNTVAAAQNTLGLLFFELLFLGFRALFTALFTFPDEFKMLLKVSSCAVCLRS